MPVCQYRMGGGGLISQYRLLFTVPLLGIPVWKRVQTLNYRDYEIRTKTMDLLNQAKPLIEQHQLVLDEIKYAKKLIESGRQYDNNRSDPKEMSIPKDASKYLKRRGNPGDSWWAFARFVREYFKLGGVSEIIATDRAQPTETSNVDRIGVTDQPIGHPAPPPKRKGGGNQQNNQQNQHGGGQQGW